MKTLMIVMVAAMALAGCDKGETVKAKVPATPRSEKTYDQMSTNDVIVIVNGMPLTKGMIERQVAVQTELAKIAKPDIKLSDLNRSVEKNRRSAERLFIEQRAMLAEAERRGFKLTDEDRREIRDRFSKGILKGRAKYGLLAGRLNDEERAELTNGLDREKLVQMVMAALRKECSVEVSEDAAVKKFKELAAYNERAKLEEARIWKSASNAWERIQGGEDFAKVAERCTTANEHVNSDMDWGEFELEFFKDDAMLSHYLTVMPEGTVTPPVTGDNGILIVKMLKKIPVDFGSNQLKPRYQLAKIFFELPEYYSFESVDKLRKEMEQQLSGEALKKRVNALIAAAKVERPNGKVLIGAKRNPRNTLTRRR